MKRLLALLLASALAAAAAHAGEPACDETTPAEASPDASPEGAPDDGCDDCGDACVDCACCRAPLAVHGRPVRLAPAAAWTGIACEREQADGVRPPSDVFQPPRA